MNLVGEGNLVPCLLDKLDISDSGSLVIEE